MAEDDRNVLVVRGATKHYGGVTALEEVDFTMERGEIHCLVGENGSGKSTLVKIITGVVTPDHAEITIAEEPVRALKPISALKRGIHVVHQDLSLFPNLTVAENIASFAYAEERTLFVGWDTMLRRARAIIDQLGLELDPASTLGDLRPADQQLVAICRALARSARVLIMDEPTASLTYEETQRLFGFIQDIKSRGVAVLFISHRLDEVLEIGERVTVLRNGASEGSYPASELDKDRIIKLMTGKEITQVRPEDHSQGGTPALSARSLTRTGEYRGVDFDLHFGEVLGLIGPRGAGRTEIALTLFGLTQPDDGTIELEGTPVQFRSNRDAMAAGIGYLPENRLEQGLVLPQSIANNVVITHPEDILDSLGLTQSEKKDELAQRAVKDFGVVASDHNAPVKTLSGGNQQKVVLAKWIQTKPKVLLLDSPTNGVDVGAKDGIRALVDRLAAEGVAILFISDEESEILQNCPRTLVMRQGRVYGPYETETWSEDDLRARVREEVTA